MIMKTLHTIYTNFAKHNMASLRLLLVMLLTLTASTVWGADYSKNESWSFNTSGNSNWSGHNSGYCGACGNKSNSFNVYKTNITNFSNIDFSKYENVSLTIYVKAGTNSGTNSYTVKLINASGNQVSTYTSTKTNGMGTGSSSSNAKESSVTFNPTMAFSGYKIEFPAKAYITQTRYVLTYDDKTVSYTINWTINPIEGGSLSATSGNTTTVTPKTAYTYGYPAYTVTSGKATVSQTDDTFTATPTENSTIQINMVEKPKYTVTLMDDNSTLTQSTAGGSVTLPPRDGCKDYTFAGWTNTWIKDQTTWTTTAPTIIPAGSYTPTANENLYPVYTKTEGGGTSYQFQQVTALSQIKAGGTFIITNGSYYLPNAQASSSGPLKADMVEVTNNGVVTGTVTDDMKWTFSAADANGKITIKSAANSNYYLYTTNDNNGLRVYTTSDTWTFEEYTVSNILGFAMKSTSRSRYCAVYTDGSNWRSYTTKDAGNYETNSGRLDLYKSTEISSNTTYYISVPNCCTQLAEVTNLKFSSITSNSITVAVPDDYSDKANASGYTFNCYSALTGGSPVATADESGTSSHTFTGLTKNTTYYFTVIAKGEGKYCNSIETSPRESSKTLAQYTVILNPNGGSGTFTGWTANGSNYTKTVDAGTQITLPTLSKTGYNFAGWHDGGTTVASSYTPTKDITLTAQWTAIEYTITYQDKKGATNSNPDTYTIEDEITFADLTNLPKGYNFTGWDPASIAKGTTGNQTVTAQWTEKPLTRYRTDCDACIPLDGYAEINGTYHFFPGETITLTVTPPANDVSYTYQWQKFVEDEWEDIDGKTTTYTKAEATIEDVGHYRCVVSAEGYCDAIAEYNVKCLQLNVYYNDHSFAFTTPLEKVDATTASISVDLQNANYTYYFEITDGCENFYGFNGDIHSGWYENVELNAMNSSTHCGLQTTKFGTYIFTVDHSYLTDDSKSYPFVTVTYPASLQEANKVIYLDNNVLKWTHSNNADGTNKIYYRIGRSDHNNKIAMDLVPGTANLYKVTTSKYDNFDVWHIANNGCHSEFNSIFKTKTNDKWAATQATAFETLPVTLDAVTVTPTTLRSVGGDDNNSNCEFYNYDITEGMKTWNAEVIEPTNGTITVKYTHHDGTAVNNFTSGNRDLAHTCLLTITATPNVGYSLTSLTVNDEPFTSGNTHTLTDDAVIKAEFTINTHTVTWKPAGGNWSGDANDIVQEYKYGAVIEAPDKPTYGCHEFVEWNPAYTVGMTMPDKDLEFTAVWNKLSYTITFKNYDGTVLQTSTVECGETPSYIGATPTREQTAQYTYTFKGWSPTIASATQDQVYTAQFTQTTRQYTVTWYDGTGNAHKTQTANYNATVALPTTNPDRCDDDYPHFIGWTADPIVGSTTTQPELVENVKVTGDCDYYAVFAKGEGGSSNYQKVTSSLDDWSGEYLIVYEAGNVAFNGGLTTLDANNNVIDVIISDNVIEASDETNSAKFTIAPYSTGYSIQSNSGKYIGKTTYDNELDESADTKYVNTISFSSGKVSIKGTGNSSGTYVALKYNSSANRFRYYKSGQSDIALYKKGSGVNYTSYITTCCTSWTAPTLTYTTPLNAETSQTAQPQLGSGTTYGDATYTSSNPSVLAVDEETGVVTAIGKGTATITVTWEGNETYCSMSATSNTITINGSYSVTFHSNGGIGTMEPQKADPSTQRIAKLNKNEFIKAGYVFVGWKDASGVAYTDEQENITLTKNITLFAQWVPIVTLNDAGNEESAHPTAVNGTITLPDGANACDPYEFVGWTSVATADWNEGIEEPELVTSPYKPTAPITLYAVYKIQDEGNPNAFKLSFEGGNGKTYYVGSYNSSPYLRGYSNITKEEAVTFIRTKMYPDNDTKYYIYMEHKSEYLYYNGTFNSTSSTPDENQGWVFHTVGDKIKLQSTYSYDPDYLSFSDRDQETINISTSASGSEFNMLSAVTSTYVASPLCNQEIEITFETGNGNFVDNAPDPNPLTVSRGDVIPLPTCEYPGYEFMGWLKDEQQLEPSDIPLTYYTGDYTVNGTSSTITFYAYYKALPEEVEFTGKDDAELLMYYYDGTENYYYAVSHAAERDELSSKQNCFNATTWTFTNVGNMQYHIQDETGKYLGAYSDGDNDLILSATPKVWTFTEVNGLWKMVCENSPSRALMYNLEANHFSNEVLRNATNGAYSYITLGICPYPTYTTNPVLSQGFSITNTAMVTSASGQKVKATSALTLETRNIELPCTFTIAAPNITFYDNTGAEVTQLTASAASEQFELHFAYKPTAENTMEYPTVTITDDEMKTYTIKNRIYARSLPNIFAVVAKVGGIWYALPSQGLNSTTPPAAYPVEVDDIADPTAVAAVPANADWSLRQVYEASRVDATKDRFVANGENLVFVNNASPAMALNASTSGNYLLTDAQYANYYQTNPGLYEWTPTTTDLETYQLTNEQRSRTLSVNTATVFGVHATDKAVEQVRFLPIQNRYTPAALQVVEWKENSVVIMYNGNPAQTASVSVNGADAQTTTLSSAQRDIAVYELAATGLAANPTQRLSITIGSEKVILPIPYIISGSKNDIDVLSGTTIAARQEVAKVSDLVVLNGATLTAAGAKSNPYKFRNATIYGGGKLVIPSDNGFGVSSLTMRLGTVNDDGSYTNSYPQLVLNGTINTGNINVDYLTTYDRYYALSLPYEVNTTSILYPADIYGDNLKDGGNNASFALQYYDGAERAKGATGWKDFDEKVDNPTLTKYQGYTFWGAPRKVKVNGATEGTRQKYGIHRIPITETASDLMKGEKSLDDNGNVVARTIDIFAHPADRPNDMGWNFLGNPYLAQYGGLSAEDEDVQVGLLEHEMVDGKWTGGWKHTGNLRYVTTTTDGQNYTAVEVDKATFSPFNTFFIQAATDGALSFACASRAQSLPARHYAAQQETAKEITTGIILTGNDQTDRTGLLIADNFTEEYDFNADLSKFENSGINLYTIGKDGNLAYMAINQALAEQPIPVGYTAPAEGLYTIAFDEDRYNATDISALYLIDYDSNEKTNLLHTDYSFVTAAGTNNQRFALQVAFAPENATNVEWVGDATVQVGVEGNTLMLNNLPTDAAVHVFDALGRLMYHAPTVPTEMQLTLPTGYYLVRIADKQNAVVIKTVIP